MQFITTITKTDKEKVIEWVNNSDHFSEAQKAIFRRIAYLTNNSENTCTAGNSYFEANFGRCARTIQRWLKTFIDCKCLVVHLVYDGKRVVKRLITISAEVLKNAVKIASNKLTLRDFKSICKRIKNDTTNFYSIASIKHPIPICVLLFKISSSKKLLSFPSSSVPPSILSLQSTLL